MVIPHFNISQNERSIELKIEAPYTKIDTENQPEVHIQDNELLFHSTPYFFRLTFDKSLLNQDETISFDNGIFTIRAVKKVPGDHFKDLDAPEKLLTLHEHLELNVCSSNVPRYGFGGTKYGVFKELQMGDVVDLEDPDEVEEKDRRSLRMKDENRSFDDSHYLADLYEDEVIQGLLEFSPVWCSTDDASNELSEEQKGECSKLPVNRFVAPFDTDQKKSVYYSLIDILLAYAYDFRTTRGLHNVESGWTICKLSSTLSWLDSFSDSPSVVRVFVRRSLCFPLYRSWKLSLAVCKDVCQILKKGKKFVLKCLLKTRELLSDHYNHYVLNELYLDDYCIWIQHVKDEILSKLANELLKFKPSKSDIGFDLEVLEAAGEATLEEFSKAEGSGHPTAATACNNYDSEEEEDDDNEEESTEEESTEEESTDDESSEEDVDDDDDGGIVSDEDVTGNEDTETERPVETSSIECKIKSLNIVKEEKD